MSRLSPSPRTRRCLQDPAGHPVFLAGSTPPGLLHSRLRQDADLLRPLRGGDANAVAVDIVPADLDPVAALSPFRRAGGRTPAGFRRFNPLQPNADFWPRLSRLANECQRAHLFLVVRLFEDPSDWPAELFGGDDPDGALLYQWADEALADAPHAILERAGELPTETDDLEDGVPAILRGDPGPGRPAPRIASPDRSAPDEAAAAVWDALLGGLAGAVVPSRPGETPPDGSDEAIQDAAYACGAVRRFLRERQVRFARMAPFDGGLARPGDRWLAKPPAPGVAVEIDLSAFDGMYSAAWWHMRDEYATGHHHVLGGTSRAFEPPDDAPWLLDLSRRP